MLEREREREKESERMSEKGSNPVIDNENCVVFACRRCLKCIVLFFGWRSTNELRSKYAQYFNKIILEKSSKQIKKKQ